MVAFLDAHERGDLEAEEALVDWEGVTPSYKASFIKNELQDGLRHRILAIDIADITNLLDTLALWEWRHIVYNITPEKLLMVQYGGSRTNHPNLYPIAQKDGRYYLVVQTGI
jgi:hypothetical protein